MANLRLEVKERVQLLGMIRAIAGDITKIRLAQEAIDTIGFTDEEDALLGFHTEGGVTRWQPDVVGAIEVELGPTVFSMIREQLRQLSEKEQLTIDMLPLYEKIDAADCGT